MFVTTFVSRSIKVFTSSQELQLEQYLKRAADIYYGLTILDFRKLAFDFALANKISFPDKWLTTKLAGSEWYYGFMKRHPSLSIRKPQATSLSRATSFNQHNVNQFFDNLETVMEREGLTSLDIWNMVNQDVPLYTSQRELLLKKEENKLEQLHLLSVELLLQLR